MNKQPDVLHIHHETRAIPNNKVLTAYVEGGESEVVPPMRTAGLDGSGEVIGVADTGLGGLCLRDVGRPSLRDAVLFGM